MFYSNSNWAQQSQVFYSSEDVSLGYHDNYNTANTNYYWAKQLAGFVIDGASGGINSNRGLIEFDLSSLDPNIIVDSARLNLFAFNDYTVYPLTTGHYGNNSSYLKLNVNSWSEQAVTWNNQPSTTDNYMVVLNKSTSPNQDYTEINVTDAVQYMISNPSNNFGFKLGLFDEVLGNNLSFHSSNSLEINKTPTLIVYYRADPSNVDNCIENLIKDNFDNLDPLWSFTGNKVFHESGKIVFNYPRGEEENRMIGQFSRQISDTYFKAQLKLNITGSNQIGNGVFANLLTLTENPSDFTELTNGQWKESNNNTLSVVLSCADYNDNNMNNWFFLFEQKIGATRTYDLNTKISFNPNILEYYIVLERLNNNSCKLSIYTDATHQNHIAGSPQTISVNPNIKNISYTQHGGLVSGNSNRTVSATIDDLIICDNISSLSLNEAVKSNLFILSPNPVISDIIVFTKNNSFIEMLKVYDMTGKAVKVKKYNQVISEKMGLNVEDLPNGIYYLDILHDGTSSMIKFIKE